MSRRRKPLYKIEQINSCVCFVQFCFALFLRVKLIQLHQIANSVPVQCCVLLTSIQDSSFNI